MTREIKFRGKRLSTREWVYGSLIQWKDGTMTIITENKEDHSEFYVNPDTVGQYTGLQDRNGKEIYEWDILVQEYQDNHGLFKDYFEARWEDAGFVGICLNNESKGFTDALESCTDYLICGNRWDNPELLEDQNNE